MSASCGDNSKKKKALNVCTFGTLKFTTPTPSVLTRCRPAGSLIQNLAILVRRTGRAGLFHCTALRDTWDHFNFCSAECCLLTNNELPSSLAVVWPQEFLHNHFVDKTRILCWWCRRVCVVLLTASRLYVTARDFVTVRLVFPTLPLHPVSRECVWSFPWDIFLSFCFIFWLHHFWFWLLVCLLCCFIIHVFLVLVVEMLCLSIECVIPFSFFIES